MLKFPIFFFFCACSSSKTAKKTPKRCHFFKFFNRSSDLFEFYRSDLQANAKKSKKKFMRVLRGKKKVVSLQSQTNGKVRERKRGRLAVLWKNGMDVANSSKIFLRRSDKVGTDKKQRNYLGWRVWSWLRMNAGGRLNTCKSNGKVRGSNTEDTRVAHGCVTRMQPTFDWNITLRNRR